MVVTTRHPAIPPLTPENEHYWKGGEYGELRLRRCQNCGHWEESPSPVCPNCWGREFAPEATGGRGFIYTFTTTHNVSYQGWTRSKAVDVPYTTVVVELDDQPSLRVTTNLVGCEQESVSVGLRVRVTFEASGDVWIPLFEPDGGGE
jgi:uncharacterized protein